MEEQKELLRYFIAATDTRLKSIEHKLEQLISFRMFLLGGAAVVSALVSAGIIIFGK